ncbi:MAG: hypothetical protein M3150_01250 [Pseudomonadota bacterium]|nr:hypothetical protein [Pseudomonadota bacterium]
MPTDPTRPDLVNPLQLWTDLGLRALESTVTTTQKMGDTLDRMARAKASADLTDTAQPSEPPATSAPDSAAGSPTGSTIALVGQIHRSAFDAMQQGWLQWMSTLGNLASVSAGGASPVSAAGDPATSQQQAARSVRLQGGNESESRVESRLTEHAHAAGDAPKRARRSAAKRAPRPRNS